ncbi:hypothetical protein TNCV_2578821 [Trichonephila clavipes]|nr:hypothetical protein TNCV_2578821 [Trichonephila clavipes]
MRERNEPTDSLRAVLFSDAERGCRSREEFRDNGLKVGCVCSKKQKNTWRHRFLIALSDIKKKKVFTFSNNFLFVLGILVVVIRFFGITLKGRISSAKIELLNFFSNYLIMFRQVVSWNEFVFFDLQSNSLNF